MPGIEGGLITLDRVTALNPLRAIEGPGIAGGHGGVTTTFSQYIANVLVPPVDVRLQEATGDLVNSGTRSLTALSLIAGAPTYGQPGDALYEGDLAVLAPTATIDFEALVRYFVPVTDAAGTWFAVVKFTGAGVYTIMEMGSTGGALACGLRVNAGRIQWSWYNTSPTNEYTLVGTQTFNDGNYHLIAVVQPNNGTGVKMYVDGVLDTPSTTVGPNGTATLNDWVGTMAALAGSGVDRTDMFAAPLSSHTLKFPGTIARCVYTNVVMTQPQLAFLNTLRSGPA